MQRGNIKVLTNSAVYRPGIDVLICHVTDEGKIVSAAEPIIFRHFEDDGQLIDRATLDGQQGLVFLQSALDAAWKVGLRPTNWKNETTDQVAAMDNHLQDMRRLVFGPQRPLDLPDLLKEKLHVG